MNKSICCKAELRPAKIYLRNSEMVMDIGYGECSDGFHRDRRSGVHYKYCSKCNMVFTFINYVDKEDLK
jgi:hypothetical protein